MIPTHITFRSISPLSSHLHPAFPSCSFPSGFPTRNCVCIFLVWSACYVPPLYYPHLFNHHTNIMGILQIMQLSPVSSYFLLGTDIPLHALFSNTRSAIQESAGKGTYRTLYCFIHTDTGMEWLETGFGLMTAFIGLFHTPRDYISLLHAHIASTANSSLAVAW
jgi:hypothetical protein